MKLQPVSNIIYIGNSGKGCDYIHCHDGFNVVAIICQDKMVNEDLVTCSYLRDIPIIKIKTHTDLKEALDQRAGSFEFAIMFSFGIIIKQDILDLHTIYNIHMSRLPAYKGKNCTFFATMAGEKSIGASLHKVVTGVDEGDIISRKLVPYYFWIGGIKLWEQLLEQIPNLLTDLKRFLTEPDYILIKNEPGVCDPPVDRSMLEINEDTPVKDIINLCRTQEMYKGIYFKYKDHTYIIKKVQVTSFNKFKNEEIEIKNKLILIQNKPTGIYIDESYFLRWDDMVTH